MPAYRMGEVARVLGVSADTVRRWADAGRLPTRRNRGGQRVVEARDLAAFMAQTAQETGARATSSARNRVTGVVTRVVKDKVAAQVELQAGTQRMVGLITREAADDLGLEPGVIATAVVKATNVSFELAG